MTTNTINNNQNEQEASTMGRVAAAIYGAVTYVVFFCTFVYAIGFIGNMVAPWTMDSGEPGPFVPAMAVNVALLGIFGIQHSVMARPAFKRWWTQFVPKQVERSTYVLFATACLALMMWKWQPMPQLLWSVDNEVVRMMMHAIYLAGWGIVLFSTYLINHFDLFGLRQVYLHLRQREYTELGFRVTGLYKFVRHPIMVGFILAGWATPDMTAGRMLFAVVITAYILVALQFEERDLVRYHGEKYVDYKNRVYGLVPLKKYSEPQTGVTVEALGD